MSQSVSEWRFDFSDLYNDYNDYTDYNDYNDYNLPDYTWPFQHIFYIFVITGLEPKLFVFKSLPQKQICRAHEIGQFCHQDWRSICLCLKVRDRAIKAFQLAQKW